MSAPATATDVALQLAKLARELDDTVRAIYDADKESVEKRGAFDLAYSRSFLQAQGSVDQRKHQAVIETSEHRMAAEVADTVVRHLRRRIDAIKTRIDVGRSYGAAVRAEITLGGSGMEP